MVLHNNTYFSSDCNTTKADRSKETDQETDQKIKERGCARTSSRVNDAQRTDLPIRGRFRAIHGSLCENVLFSQSPDRQTNPLHISSQIYPHFLGWRSRTEARADHQNKALLSFALAPAFALHAQREGMT